jgi:RNA polymerase sigma-70 factor (ECF subfamily)
MNQASVELLDRARAGDAEAFASVFEALRPVVFAVACRLVGPDDANDVVMDAYLKAWQSLPGFRGGSSLRTWLYRITRNCALDRLRRRTRERAWVVHDEEGGGPPDVPDPGEPGPDARLEQAEERTLVRTAMAQLSQEHRVALELRYADGLSYAELAAATGVSIGTVMSRLFHAKRRLSRIIRGETK